MGANSDQMQKGGEKCQRNMAEEDGYDVIDAGWPVRLWRKKTASVRSLFERNRFVLLLKCQQLILLVNYIISTLVLLCALTNSDVLQAVVKENHIYISSHYLFTKTQKGKTTLDTYTELGPSDSKCQGTFTLRYVNFQIPCTYLYTHDKNQV